MNAQDTEILEQLLDRNCLQDLIDALCGICVEKVHHIDENWQDRELSKKWARTASKLAKFHATLEKLP